MTRIVHTADWHLGARLIDCDRHDEHRAFLEWLLAQLAALKPDLLIVAGDIFDSATPPQEALQLYYHFLARLAAEVRCRTLILGGNHDSPATLHAPRELLAALDIRVLATPPPPDRIAAALLELPDAVVCAVPFLRERDVRTAEPGQSPDAIAAAIRAGIARHYRTLHAAARVRAGSRPLIATGHLTAVGSQLSASERSIHIGNLGAIEASCFDGFAYTALGHIHRPQAVGGDDRVRYVGSPLPLSFSEVDGPKEIRVIDLADAQLTHRPVRIPVFRRLQRLTTSAATLAADLAAQQAAPGEPLLPWLELTVVDAHLHPDLDRQVREASAGLRLRVLKVLAPPPPAAARRRRVGRRRRARPRRSDARGSLRGAAPPRRDRPRFAGRRCARRHLRRASERHAGDGYRGRPGGARMKILRLRLSNLNSLRGPNAIDFTQPPLAASGLFAITGPTGAGKTTLLDAITLALYGRVARYGSVPSPDAMMSRHTGECSAEVEFACAAGTFRSTWQLQRARKKPDGKLQAAKRRVIALPAETVVAESIKEADAKILELTGLDYDRFLRSVLLAQGDFAAFLRAGPKERTDLLQQVTGTGIYQDISQAAFRRAADAEQAHAELLRAHQAVPVLSAEDLARHETDLAAQVRRAAELNLQLRALTQRLAAATRWVEIETAARQLADADKTHVAATQAAAECLARLSRHEQASPFVADLTALDRIDAALAKDRASFLALAAQQPQLARSVADADATAQQAQAALAAAEEGHAQQTILWAAVTELDQARSVARETQKQVAAQHAVHEKAAAHLATTLAADRRTLEQIAQAQSAAAAWLRDHATDAELAEHLPGIQTAATRLAAHAASAAAAAHSLAEHRTAIERLAVARRALGEKLSPLQTALKTKTEAVAAARRTLETASQGAPLTDVEARRDQARERRLAFERLAADAARLRTLLAELAANRKEAAATAVGLSDVAKENEHAQQRIVDTARLLDARRQTLGFAEKVQSLESHRAALAPDTPCPLCGALHHPYTSGHADADLAALRDQVTAAETDHELARRQHATGEQRRAAFLADDKRLATAHAKLSAEFAASRAAWMDAASASAFTAEFIDEAALAAEVGRFRAEEARLHTQVAAVRAAAQTCQQADVGERTAQAEFDTLQNDLAKQAALTAQLEAQRPGLEATLADHRRNSADERAALMRLGSTFGTVPEAVGDVADFVEALRGRAKTFDAGRAQEQNLSAELATRKTACDTLARQHATAVETVAASQRQVDATRAEVAERERIRREKFGERAVADAQREAAVGLKTARDRVELARREAESHRHALTTATQETQRLTQAIDAALGERRAIDERLLAALAAAGFADLPALRAALLAADEVAVLGAQRRRLEEQRITLAARHAALVTQRAALPTAAGEDAGQADALRADQTAREAERAEAQGKIGELRAALKNDAEQRERQAAFGAGIEAARRDSVRWDRLRALIGSADGTLFARFAQGLTLERLTVLANRQLVQLNPRYSIRRAADGDAADLELEIVDHYQAGVARPMRSLSGGESFLVSLALALGLSELAGGRTSIESLFIDEGFGSLDADTLETAMAALENLQAAGKTIGVISHVPAMQERIPAQIKITKESGGCSTVTLSA